MNKRVLVVLQATLALILGLALAGCGGGGGGGGDDDGGGGTPTLTVSVAQGGGSGTPVNGVRIYLVNGTGNSASRSSGTFTDLGGGNYQWTGSTSGASGLLVIAPATYWRNIIGHRLTAGNGSITVYQTPVNVDSDPPSPITPYDPTQYAIIPLTPGQINQGELLVYTESGNPPSIDFPQ